VSNSGVREIKSWLCNPTLNVCLGCCSKHGEVTSHPEIGCLFCIKICIFLRTRGEENRSEGSKYFYRNLTSFISKLALLNWWIIFAVYIPFTAQFFWDKVMLLTLLSQSRVKLTFDIDFLLELSDVMDSSLTANNGNQ